MPSTAERAMFFSARRNLVDTETYVLVGTLKLKMRVVGI
jgi:hypothetical protein